MQRRIAAALAALLLIAFAGSVSAAESPSGTIRVQLEDTEDSGLSLAGAEISIKAEGQKEQTAKTDENGRAVFESVPDGRYTVRLTQAPEGMTPAAQAEGTVTVQGSAKSVKLTAGPKPASVSPYVWADGQLLQANGQPVTLIRPEREAPGKTEPVLLKDAVTLQESGRDLMRAVMYYGFGGPGYEPQDGQSEEDAERAVILARTYAFYSGSKEGEAYRKTQDAAFWKEHVTPLLETVVYEKSQNGKVLRDVPSAFNPAAANLSDRFTSPILWMPQTPGDTVTKLVSSRTDWTDGSGLYSLSGGVFALLNEQDEPQEIVISEDGTVKTHTGGRLAALKAPPGYEPAPAAEAGGEITLTPRAAPLSGALFSLASEHGEAVDYTGSRFRLALYKGSIGSAKGLTGHLSLMEWTVSPAEDGSIVLDEEHKLSGDDVPQSLPLGTLELKSITEPAGWAPVHEVRTLNGPDDTAVPARVKLQPVTAGITMQLEAGAGYTGAATLDDTVFELTNKGESVIYAAGEPVPPGGAVAQLVSDKDGSVTTAKTLLPAGTYELTMKQGPVGFEPKAFAPATIHVTESGMKDLGSLDGALHFDLIEADVTVRKTDAAGEPMEGTLMKVTSETTGRTWEAKADADGTITFSGLPYDTYATEELPPEEAGRADDLASFRFTVRESGTLDLGSLASDTPDGLTEANLPDEAPPAHIPEWKDNTGSVQTAAPSAEPEAAPMAVQTASPTPVPTQAPSPTATPSPLGADGKPDIVPKTDDAKTIWPYVWLMIMSGLAGGWIVWTYRERGFVF